MQHAPCGVLSAKPSRPAGNGRKLSFHNEKVNHEQPAPSCESRSSRGAGTPKFFIVTFILTGACSPFSALSDPKSAFFHIPCGRRTQPYFPDHRAQWSLNLSKGRDVAQHRAKADFCTRPGTTTRNFCDLSSSSRIEKSHFSPFTLRPFDRLRDRKLSLFTFHFSLFTFHFSLLTSHFSLFTFHFSTESTRHSSHRGTGCSAAGRGSRHRAQR